MKQRLELVSPVRFNGMEAKRKLLQNIVDESDGIRLIVGCEYLECPYPRGVVDGRLLEATSGLAVRPLERDNLKVYLNMKSRDLLFVAAGVERPTANSRGKASHAMTNQDPIDACKGNSDSVVSLQVPDNSLRPEVILGSELQDFVYGLLGNRPWMLPGYRPIPRRSRFPLDIVAPFPLVIGSSWNGERPAGLGHVIPCLSLAYLKVAILLCSSR